jgi:hypothetical protein
VHVLHKPRYSGVDGFQIGMTGSIRHGIDRHDISLADVWAPRSDLDSGSSQCERRAACSIC